ncbi:hypothetical protein EMCRGX_G021296 [Ephydatia muelleri]
MEAGVSSGSAALASEGRKHRANDAKCKELGWLCVPLIANTYGAWGNEAVEPSPRLATLTCRPKLAVLRDIYGRLSLHLLRAILIRFGHRFHTAGAEPYFFDNSYTHTKQHGAIPVDLNGRCVVAEEIKDRDKVTMRPLKWKCTNECRKLTSEEVAIVLKTNSLFQKSIEDLRAGLDALDSGCGHVHYDVTLKSHSGFIDQLGHSIYCELPECSSPLRIIRAAMPHFPALRTFTRLLYKARKCHMTILAIDSALASGNIEELIPFMGMKDNLSDLFSEDGVEHAVVSEDHSSSGLGCIERDLKVTHADLIAELHHPEKKKASVRDSYKADPEIKKASVRDSYNADIESKQSAKRQRYQEDVEENCAAKREKYEDNSDAIKASERNRYWNDPAVRLAKRAAERKRFRMGHRTTTTTQSYSLYEPKSHALMEYNGGLEKAILRDSELLSEVNDAFCKSHPLLAQKVVTRSACAAVSKIGADALVSKALSVRRAKAGSLLNTIQEVNALKLEENDILVRYGYHNAGSLPPWPLDAVLPPLSSATSSSSSAAPTPTTSSSRATPTTSSRELPPPPAAAELPERKRYRRGHRTTTTTQSSSTAPPTPAVAVPPPAAAAELPPPPPAVAAELPPPPPAVAAELPPPAEAGALLPAPAPPPAQAVLTPVPPPPLRLLLPWPLPPPPTWLPWPEPGRRGHRRGWGRHRGQGRTVNNI